MPDPFVTPEIHRRPGGYLGWLKSLSPADRLAWHRLNHVNAIVDLCWGILQRQTGPEPHHHSERVQRMVEQLYVSYFLPGLDRDSILLVHLIDAVRLGAELGDPALAFEDISAVVSPSRREAARPHLLEAIELWPMAQRRKDGRSKWKAIAGLIQAAGLGKKEPESVKSLWNRHRKLFYQRMTGLVEPVSRKVTR